MSDEKTISVQVGPGFCGTLTIVFIVMKLMNYIDWSWIWVLCPLWIGFAIVLVAIAITFVVLLLNELFKK